MKSKVIIFSFLFLNTILYFSAQETIKKQKSVGEGEIVYFSYNDIYYHYYQNCPKLTGPKIGITSKDAIKKELKPCSECMFEAVKINEIPESQQEQKLQQEIINIKSGFRQTTWGMNQAQIKQQEKSELIKKDVSQSTGLDIVSYKGKAGNFDCLIAYYFAGDKLVEGRYIFLNKHVNKNLFIDDYKEIKSSLIEKYKNPSGDNVIWKSDLYKNDPSDWGMAIGAGHLAYETTWQLQDTLIRLQLYGDNFDISLVLGYQSTLPAHVDAIKKAQEKAKKAIW